MVEFLDNISVTLSPNPVLERLHFSKTDEEKRAMVQELIDLVQSAAKPKALYTVAYVDEKHEDALTIDGVTFTSRVLRKNLDTVNRVFPYLVTVGTAVDDLTVDRDDFVRYYSLDVIKDMLLRGCVRYLQKYLLRRYALQQVSRMSPGSLKDWPITQQKELFTLFDTGASAMGVTLTDSFLMVPVKSVSGILFTTKIKFESCQLCPREICDGRRAPYSPELARQYQLQT